MIELTDVPVHTIRDYRKFAWHSLAGWPCPYCARRGIKAFLRFIWQTLENECPTCLNRLVREKEEKSNG